MKIPKWLLPLVSVALISFLLTQIDLPATLRVLAGANPALVLAAIASTTASIALKTLRWKILLAEKQDFGLLELFPIQAAGIATSNFSPGKLAEPLKVLPLKERGLSYSFGMVSVFWERAFDLLVLFGFALSVLSALNDGLRLVLQALFLLLVLVVLLMFRHYEKVLEFVKKHVKLPILQEVKPHSFRKTTLIASFFVTAVAWVFDALVMFLAFWAVGLNYDFLRFASAYFASIIVGVVSFLPGGLGSTEAALILLLAPAKEALPQVFSGIILGRVCSLGYASLLGFALLPRVRRKNA